VPLLLLLLLLGGDGDGDGWRSLLTASVERQRARVEEDCAPKERPRDQPLRVIKRGEEKVMCLVSRGDVTLTMNPLPCHLPKKQAFLLMV